MVRWSRLPVRPPGGQLPVQAGCAILSGRDITTTRLLMMRPCLPSHGGCAGDGNKNATGWVLAAPAVAYNLP
jgi:hypothetical protein